MSRDVAESHFVRFRQLISTPAVPSAAAAAATAAAAAATAGAASAQTAPQQHHGDQGAESRLQAAVVSRIRS